MKKYIFILLFSPLLTMAQKTYVPDNSFEYYLESNNMGDGISYNDSVWTSAIETVTLLFVENLGIVSLEGIEDFTALKKLYASYNGMMTSLDLSQNINLEELALYNNSLTSLDLSNNINLKGAYLANNYLTSLNISGCSSLVSLTCDENLLTTLDASGLTNLKYLECHSNNISNLNITGCTALEELIVFKNNLTTIDLNTNINLKEINCWGNDITNLDVSANPNLNNNNAAVLVSKNNLTYLNLQNGDPIGPGCFASDNPNLTCVQVNDVAYANANFTGFDSGVYFDTYCPPYVAVEEETIEEEILKDRTLIRIVDILGRETKVVQNTLLLYIYDDGSVEKKVIID